MNCGLRNEYKSDLRRNEHYLSSGETKAWKNSGLWGNNDNDEDDHNTQKSTVQCHQKTIAENKREIYKPCNLQKTLW